MNLSFLERNVKVLKKHRFAVVEWLLASEDPIPEIRARFVSNRWKLPDWKLSTGKTLFEDAPPTQCYRDWTPKEGAATGATIVVGCNLGYGINSILAKTPDSHKILVIEPRPEMLSVCLSQTDYTPFFEIGKLIFLPPDQEKIRQALFKKLMLQYEFGKIDLHCDRPSRGIGPEYRDWYERCKFLLKDFSIEMNTWRVHHESMIRNELDNLPRAVNEGSLLRVRGCGNGSTGVIFGAGPSLEQFASFFAENSGKTLYCAPFQILPALRSHGLKPHFSLAIDFSPAMMKTYDRVDSEWLKEIPLIYSCKVRKEMVDAYPGRTLPLWTVGGLGGGLWNGSELVLNTGRNVGIALLRFLVFCGVRRIVFAGCDFAWKGAHTHAAGHVSDGTPVQFDSSRHVELKNKFGESIYSHPVYLTALAELETEIRHCGVSAFNLYGGYAGIEGAQDVDQAGILEKGLLNSEPGSVANLMEKLMTARKSEIVRRFEARGPNWGPSLKSVQKRLEKLFLKPEYNKKDIEETLRQVLFFLGQDPLYQPLLIAEIRSLTGLVFTKVHYSLKDLIFCKQLFKTVLRKVREMDRMLAEAL